MGCAAVAVKARTAPEKKRSFSRARRASGAATMVRAFAVCAVWFQNQAEGPARSAIPKKAARAPRISRSHSQAATKLSG